MRLSQTTAGVHPSWSQAAGTGQGFDWSSTLDRALSDTPSWVLTVTAGTVVLVLVAMAYLTGRGLWRASERARKRRQAEQDKAVAEGREAEVIGLGNMGRQAYVALGGMVVSVYGMWGFALGTAKLPEFIAVGFIGMFDAMELVLFSQLYKRANPKVGWTTQLRLIHNTAWALVAVSATANFIHAPNPVAAPFMAAMPIGAAWVIELEFRARMSGAEKPDDKSNAGPIRLFVLLWTKGWAAAFSGLGLDPNSTSGQVARATLAKKAANQLFKLRTTLANHAGLLQNQQARRKDLTKAVKELDAQRRKTTRAMNRSDFAVDSSQALAVLRELAGWTRVDDVATVDTSDTQAVTQLMEEVAILPSAKRIEAAERAAELEEAAERAEAARVEAESARERAEEEKRAAVEEKTAAESARKAAEEALATAAAETEAARKEMSRAVAARQEAETARKRAESEMTEESRNVTKLTERAEREQQLLAEASEELARVQGEIAAEATRRKEAAAEVSSIRDELQYLENERTRTQDAVRSGSGEAQQIQKQVEELRGALIAAQSAAREHSMAAEKAADLRREAEENQRLASEVAARARAEAREAAELLESLRPQLADRLGGQAEAAALAAAPAFRSDEKQAGWNEYFSAAEEGRELPTAKEMSIAYSISEGNARNWIIEFGKIRAGMIATGSARQSEGETARSEVRRARSSNARQEPRDGHADGHQRAEDAAQTRSINGQRQPV